MPRNPPQARNLGQPAWPAHPAQAEQVCPAPCIGTGLPPTISNCVTVVTSAAATPTPHPQEGPWRLSGWALNGTSSVN